MIIIYIYIINLIIYNYQSCLIIAMIHNSLDHIHLTPCVHYPFSVGRSFVDRCVDSVDSVDSASSVAGTLTDGNANPFTICALTLGLLGFFNFFKLSKFEMSFLYHINIHIFIHLYCAEKFQKWHSKNMAHRSDTVTPWPCWPRWHRDTTRPSRARKDIIDFHVSSVEASLVGPWCSGLKARCLGHISPKIA